MANDTYNSIDNSSVATMVMLLCRKSSLGISSWHMTSPVIPVVRAQRRHRKQPLGKMKRTLDGQSFFANYAIRLSYASSRLVMVLQIANLTNTCLYGLYTYIFNCSYYAYVYIEIINEWWLMKGNVIGWKIVYNVARTWCLLISPSK